MGPAQVTRILGERNDCRGWARSVRQKLQPDRHFTQPAIEQQPTVEVIRQQGLRGGQCGRGRSSRGVSRRSQYRCQCYIRCQPTDWCRYRDQGSQCSRAIRPERSDRTGFVCATSELQEVVRTTGHPVDRGEPVLVRLVDHLVLGGVAQFKTLPRHTDGNGVVGRGVGTSDEGIEGQ